MKQVFGEETSKAVSDALVTEHGGDDKIHEFCRDQYVSYLSFGKAFTVRDPL